MIGLYRLYSFLCFRVQQNRSQLICLYFKGCPCNVIISSGRLTVIKYLIILIIINFSSLWEEQDNGVSALSFLSEDQNKYDLLTEGWIIFCFHARQTTPLNCKPGHYLTTCTTLGHRKLEYNLKDSTLQETQTHDIIEIFWVWLCFISQWIKLRSNPDDRKDKNRKQTPPLFPLCPYFLLWELTIGE